MKSTPSIKPTEQIIPFPFPPYLSTYIGHKLDTHPVLSDDGSILRPFNVTRKTYLGKLVLRALSISPGPVKKNHFTFFIKISQFSTNKQDKQIANARNNFLRLSDDEVKDIEDVFKYLFESNLKEHVEGFIKGVKNENPTKKRGVVETAILDFCVKHGVVFTNQNLSAWKQQLVRGKITPSNHKIKVL